MCVYIISEGEDESEKYPPVLLTAPLLTLIVTAGSSQILTADPGATQILFRLQVQSQSREVLRAFSGQWSSGWSWQATLLTVCRLPTIIEIVRKKQLKCSDWQPELSLRTHLYIVSKKDASHSPLDISGSIVLSPDCKNELACCLI